MLNARVFVAESTTKRSPKPSSESSTITATKGPRARRARQPRLTRVDPGLDDRRAFSRVQRGALGAWSSASTSVVPSVGSLWRKRSTVAPMSIERKSISISRGRAWAGACRAARWRLRRRQLEPLGFATVIRACPYPACPGLLDGCYTAMPGGPRHEIPPWSGSHGPGRRDRLGPEPRARANR